MSDAGRFRRAANVVTRVVAGETVLVPLAPPKPGVAHVPEFYVLNDVGQRLWAWLASPVGSTELARNLMAEYDVSDANARADVQAFLESLLAIRAIEPSEAG